MIHQNLFDVAILERAELQGNAATGFQPIRAVSLSQTQ
jgi:hypothetical protein